VLSGARDGRLAQPGRRRVQQAGDEPLDDIVRQLAEDVGDRAPQMLAQRPGHRVPPR
jgi:hypothetical protein